MFTLLIPFSQKEKALNDLSGRSTPYINRIAHFEGVLKNILKIFLKFFQIPKIFNRLQSNKKLAWERPTGLDFREQKLKIGDCP